MARKREYFKTINKKDIMLLKAFYCCHHISKENILDIISPNRILSYQKQGLVEKQFYLENQGIQTAREVYALTDKGRKWVQKNIDDMRYTSAYQSKTAVEHNIKLSELYLKEMQSDNNARWLTERDLKDIFLTMIEDRNDYYQLLDEYKSGHISIPDGAIIRSGEVTLIEVITYSYTEDRIAAKENYSAIMSLPIEFYKA